MSNSIIIIPSRLAATRLPQKPLIKINNKTLIMHVYEKAIESRIGEVYVATCDEEIASEVRKNGGKFIMTDINHTTGTDRVFEASQKLNLKDIDFIMNIQGDEPMINPFDIKNLDKLKISFNIYLYCSLDILTQRASRNNLRPLLNEDTSLQMKNLFNERKDIYNKAADITINATINPKNTINEILKEINNDN